MILFLILTSPTGHVIGSSLIINNNFMQTIDTYNFQGKRALIRVDFNVPLNDKFEITDDTRMRAAVPTIKKVLAGGGSVILMSHLDVRKVRRPNIH